MSCWDLNESGKCDGDEGWVDGVEGCSVTDCMSMPITDWRSCAEIDEAGAFFGDGLYWIDPTGADPFQVTCVYNEEKGVLTRIDELTDFPMIAYTGFASAQHYRYAQSDVRIKALRDISLEARQQWTCEVYNRKGDPLGFYGFGFKGSPGDEPDRDLKDLCLKGDVGLSLHTETAIEDLTSQAELSLPVSHWLVGGCGPQSGGACTVNVGHVYFGGLRGTVP